MDYGWHSYLRGKVPQTQKDKRPIHKKGMTPLKLFYTSFYKISKVYVSENITKGHLCQLLKNHRVLVQEL